MENITNKAVQKQIDSLFDAEFDDDSCLTKLIDR